MSRDDLYTALDALSAAHGARELASAMRSVQRSVQLRRADFQKKYGPMTTAIMEAWDLRVKMKAAGTPDAELDAGVEGVLRQAWLRDRQEPWKFLCELCNDTGLQMFVCRTGQRCPGRSSRDGGNYRLLCATNPTSEYTHDYGLPCVCERGARFRSTPKQPADYSEVGKPTKKPGGFSRFGGR